MIAAGSIDRGLLMDNSSDDSELDEDTDTGTEAEGEPHRTAHGSTRKHGSHSHSHYQAASHAREHRHKRKIEFSDGEGTGQHRVGHGGHRASGEGNGHGHGHGHEHEHDHDQVAHAEHAYHRLHLMVYFVQIILNSKIIEELVSDNAESTGKMHKAVFFADEVVFYAYNTFTQLVTCTLGTDFNVQFLLIIAAPAVFILALTAL